MTKPRFSASPLSVSPLSASRFLAFPLCSLSTLFFCLGLSTLLPSTLNAEANRPATTIENDSANHSANHSAKSQQLFRHRVALSSEAGLPATIALVVDEQKKVRTARAFLTLDGNFSAIPFQKFDDSGAYLAHFPSPKKTLSYQIQLTYTDGSGTLSEQFRQEAHCDKLLFKKTTAGRISAEKLKLIERIFELEQEEQIYNYLRGAMSWLMEEDSPESLSTAEASPKGPKK